MDPWTFQAHVAAELEREGYRTEPRPTTNDWGVDLFATRGDERMAVQVKKYRGARLVNRQQIFELYGASRYFDCTGAIVATDGELRRDAERAATKLGIRVMHVDSRVTGDKDNPSATRVIPAAAVRQPGLDFETIWRDHVIPLAGQTLTGDRGLRNRIIEVNWGGVRRESSTGARSWIPIEPFRWAIETILEFGSVTRQEINEQYAGRASSGIQLILERVPFFEVAGRPSTIRLRAKEAAP
jgi:restriction system protein